MPLLIATDKGNLIVKDGKSIKEIMDKKSTHELESVDGYPVGVRGEDVNIVRGISQAEYDGSKKKDEDAAFEKRLLAFLQDMVKRGILSDSAARRAFGTLHPENPNPGEAPRIITPQNMKLV